MASNHNLGGNYWGYLITPEKSASTLLEQLCIGLAKTIAQLEPPNAGPKNKLTPQRLAAFYRSVGGNYDNIFVHNSYAGVSFMYKTFGCFHTLQPTADPHVDPQIPALTSQGFVKWQTVQILLTPNEHVPFLQEAVRKYDVPRGDGGFFPKHIPRESFPDRPDEAMEKWHRHVTGRLNQETEQRRLKNSPYASPYIPSDRVESYFSPNGKLPPPQIRRPSKSRTSSHDQDPARRRSSVPELPSPQPVAGDNPQFATDAYGHRSDRRRGSSRSHSAHRPSNSSSHRPSNTPLQPRLSNSAHRPSNQSNGYHQVNGFQPYPVHSHHRQKSGGHRPHSPSTVDESSGSEASSEASPVGEDRNNRNRRRSSLWPPSFLNHKRRHSHDASLIAEKKPPLPPRPNGNSHHSRQRSGTQINDSPNRPVFRTQLSPVSSRPAPAGAPAGGPNGVQFRDRIFDNGPEDAAISAPEYAPAYQYNGQARQSASQPRPVDPPPQNPRQIMDVGAPLSPQTSGSSGQGTDRGGQRRSGMPIRVQATTGVGGRRYPNGDPRSATDRRSVAAMLG